MVLLRACLRVAIYFLRALVALFATYVAKFLAWLVRRVFIVCISLRTITVPLATTSSTILFMSFFPNPLDGVFSIASTVFVKAILTLLKPSHVSSSTEGLDIPSILFG